MVACLNLLVLNIKRMNWWFETSIDKENLSLDYEKKNSLKVLPSKFVRHAYQQIDQWPSTSIQNNIKLWKINE